MNKKMLTSLVLAVGTFGLTTGCVKQNEYDALQSRVQQQDRQLQQLQPAQADSWAQMQSMRQELNAVKGAMDDLQQAGGARALVDKVNRHDTALRQVESSLAMDLHLNDPAAVPAPPAVGEAPAAGTPQAGMGMVSPMPATGTMGVSPQSTVASHAPQAQAAPAAPVAPAPRKDMATALYDAGLAAYNGRKYQEAQRSFSDFTKNYASNKNISAAYFYLGECSFQRNQFADAALSYDTVITKYGSSAKAPLAYLKQGIAFSKLGQNAAAKARMQELIKKYPTSAEAARAKTFLNDNK
ncbi:MAG: tetratricopeptide repeat protein [Desulfovibrionaceae bacterium]